MKQIWKYELNFSGNEISVPEHSNVCTVQMQNEKPCIWFEVETTKLKTTRTFKFYPTGDEIPERTCYFGTVQLNWTVWHLYEVLK